MATSGRLLAKEPARRLHTPTQLLQALPTVTAAIQAGRPLTPQGLRKVTFAGRHLLFNKDFSSFATEEKHFERPLNLVDAQAVGDDLTEVGAVLLQPL